MKKAKSIIISFGIILSIIMFIIGLSTQKGDKVDTVYYVGFWIGIGIMIIGLLIKTSKKTIDNNVDKKIDIKTEYKEYNFKSLQSGNATIIINKDKITIKRSGLLAANAHGLTGEKTIKINQISAVQLKEAKTTIGYIQFVIIGSQESKGGLQDAMNDENTVCFDGGFDPKKVNNDAREIKNYIDNYSDSNEKNVIIKKDDKYDELLKIKKLLDEGIITKEEFNSEKKKIMNKK